MNKMKFWALLIAAFLLVATVAGATQSKAPPKPSKSKSGSADKPKEHQATGKVVSFSATSLVISKAVGKKTSEWTFVLTPKTKTQGTLAKGGKVTVHYHEDKDQKIADRIKVWEASSGTKPAAKSKSSKSKS